MGQWRTLRKIKESLPKTPVKRAAVLSAYTKDQKSPTVQILRNMNVIKSSEVKKVNAMNSTIIENIQEIISTTKRQRSKTALTVINVLTTSISSETISKKHVSRNLGLNNKRLLSRGRQHRASLLKSDNASWNFTKRKTRSDAISDEQKKKPRV